MRTQVVTINMPYDLQQRLEHQADKQGVSVNQLINYFLTIQLTQLETLSALETRLTQKTIPDLKAKVSAILDRVPDRDVPVWDERGA
jgi:hypothetical protein